MSFWYPDAKERKAQPVEPEHETVNFHPRLLDYEFVVEGRRGFTLDELYSGREYRWNKTLNQVESRSASSWTNKWHEDARRMYWRDISGCSLSRPMQAEDIGL